MMLERRFVLDTNVTVSAVPFANRTPRRALDLAQDLGVILASDETFEELSVVLLRDKFDRYITQSKRLRFLDDFVKTIQFVEPVVGVKQSRGPGDDKYLTIAVNGSAECIITGDSDLLVLNPFRTIRILTATDFLEAIN
jgi:putative PIN family toxin of toxin-antitoxin system